MASYKKIAPGNWEYRFKYKDRFTSKFREKSKAGHHTKAEAEAAAAEAKKKIAQGYDQGDLPLVDYLNNWINNYQKGINRKNTIKQHMNNVETHIAPHFKKMMLKDVTHELYQAFLDSKVASGLYKRRTIEIIHTTMNSALERAVIQGKIERSPCDGAIIKGEKTKKEIQFIDSEYVPIFLKASHQYGYIYWIFFKVMIETGLRKGEAAALKWQDIDFKNRTIRVDETLDFQPEEDENGELELFGDTKTISSERTIKVSEGLLNDLRFHAKWQNQNKLNLEGLYHHDLNLVLCRADGNFMPKSTLFNAFQRILKRAELPDLPIHSLRHSCAVIMLEAEADMSYVQEYLGHGSRKITEDVYAHISKKLEKRNDDKIQEYKNKLFGGVLGAPND